MNSFQLMDRIQFQDLSKGGVIAFRMYSAYPRLTEIERMRPMVWLKKESIAGGHGSGARFVLNGAEPQDH